MVHLLRHLALAPPRFLGCARMLQAGQQVFEAASPYIYFGTALPEERQ
jgi:hypothetical protein